MEHQVQTALLPLYSHSWLNLENTKVKVSLERKGAAIFAWHIKPVWSSQPWYRFCISIFPTQIWFNRDHFPPAKSTCVWRDKIPEGLYISPVEGRRPPDGAIWVQTLAKDIVLFFWARYFTLTVPLPTQVYKWLPVTFLMG